MQNLTLTERERLYYMTNHPDLAIVQQAVDLETESHELSWENDRLKQQITDWDDWK